MPFPYDRYPWLNFQELNLAYFIQHFQEIFEQWTQLLADNEAWKTATEQDLEDWKADTLGALEVWKTETESSIEGWESTTLAALTAWQTAAETAFEAIRVQAAASATAAAGSAMAAQTAQTAAEAAQTAAEAAQTAAEAAAASISSRAADISQNRRNIEDLSNSILNGIYNAPYTPSNMSVDENGKIALTQGYIGTDNGQTYASSSGKYYRSQVGADGLNSFLKIGDKGLYITCDNVDFAEWTCWSYSGDRTSTATHTNTHSRYQACSIPIFIPHNSTDTRFAFSVRTVGTSDSERPTFTEAQLSTIKNNIKFWVATDSGLSIIGAAADAETVGRSIRNIRGANAVDITENIPSISSSQYGTILAFTRGGAWTKTGAASQTKFLTIVDESSSASYGFEAGKSYYVEFNSSALSASNYNSIDLVFYKNINGSMVTSPYASFDGQRKFGIIHMPTLEEGFTGITLRLRTKTNAPTNAEGSIKIYSAFPNQILSASFKSRKQHRIAFFGDSIMAGANGNDETTYRNIPDIAAYNLSANYYNYGVSGAGFVHEGTGNVNAYDIISSKDLSSFDTVVICFGVNDGFHPIGAYNSTNESECLGQFNKIITYLGTNYPNKRIIVIGPFNGRNAGSFPKYWYGTVPSSAYSRGTLSDTLKQACEYYNVPYIDQKDGPINGYSIGTLIGADGVHPSQDGYDALGAWIAGELARLIS